MGNDRQWRNRIVGHGTEAPDQLLANPANWRIHPIAQRNALAAVLDSVGWVQGVIVNRTSGHVVDGHLRVALALSRDEPTLPVAYVELSADDEAIVLASLDPLAAMAGTDKEKLGELLAAAKISDDDLRAAIAEVAGLPTPASDDDDDLSNADEVIVLVPQPSRTTIKTGDLLTVRSDLSSEFYAPLLGECKAFAAKQVPNARPKTKTNRA